MVSFAYPCRRKERATGRDREGSETKGPRATAEPLFGACKAKAMEVAARFTQS